VPRAGALFQVDSESVRVSGSTANRATGLRVLRPRVRAPCDSDACEPGPIVLSLLRTGSDSPPAPAAAARETPAAGAAAVTVSESDRHRVTA
jgi:hypothetical protein